VDRFPEGVWTTLLTGWIVATFVADASSILPELARTLGGRPGVVRVQAYTGYPATADQQEEVTALRERLRIRGLSA
jgi:hypothetical protein